MKINSQSTKTIYKAFNLKTNKYIDFWRGSNDNEPLEFQSKNNLVKVINKQIDCELFAGSDGKHKFTSWKNIWKDFIRIHKFRVTTQRVK